MTQFWWLYDQADEYLSTQKREREKREVFRREIESMPDLGARLGELYAAYPWASPGVLTSVAKLGVPINSPIVMKTMQSDFERRTEEQDWVEPGETLGKPDFPTTAELFGGVTTDATEQEAEAGQEEGTEEGTALYEGTSETP